MHKTVWFRRWERRGTMRVRGIVCVCVCVCQRERERERERSSPGYGMPVTGLVG